MPMDSQRFEEIMTALNNQELSHSERGELLQELRERHTMDWEEYNDLSTSNESLKSENNDLLLANSRYFNQLSVNQSNEPDQEEVQQTISETITLDDLGNN